MTHETTTPRPTRVDLPADAGLRPTIGKIGLLFTGIGSVIGSGWLFAALDSSRIAGPAALLAWILCLVMYAVIGLTYAELGSMFPVAGGVARYPQYSFGSFASFTMGWITWLALVSVPPIEVLATLTYASNYIPDVTRTEDGVAVLTGLGMVFAVVLMLFYTVLNVMGAKAFARFNNVLVWWKLGVIVLVIIAFALAAFHPHNFNASEHGGFAPNGLDAVFVALAAGGIGFTLTGFRQGIELAAETDNPKKNVPFAVLGSIVICALLFIALQVVFVGALPESALEQGWSHLSFANDFGPLAGLALILGLSGVAVILYVDAIVSPLDAGIIYAAVAARLSYSQGRNGNAPAWLTKLNRQGAPWTSIVVMFVVGCLFLLPFPSWQKAATFYTSATLLSFGSGPLVLATLRKQLPDQPRPFRVKGGAAVPLLALLCSNLIVYWAGWETVARLFIAVVAGYVVLALTMWLAKDRTRIPPLQMSSFSWIAVWFVGLALISWLGQYGGGRGVIPSGIDALAVAALSGLTYWVAVRKPLTSEQVVENVERTRMAEAEPEAG